MSDLMFGRDNGEPLIDIETLRAEMREFVALSRGGAFVIPPHPERLSADALAAGYKYWTERAEMHERHGDPAWFAEFCRDHRDLYFVLPRAA